MKNLPIFLIILKFQHPAGIDSADQLIDLQDKLFLLASKQNPDLLLRGQLVIDDSRSYFVFLIAPWVTDVDLLEGLGFSMQDFPVHRSIIRFPDARSGSKSFVE